MRAAFKGRRHESQKGMPLVRKQQPHAIFAQDDSGKSTDALLAYVHPASPAIVAKVLAKPVGDLDGRSEYCWLRLQNGDLMLGVFPHGDTYFEVEDDAKYPG